MLFKYITSALQTRHQHRRKHLLVALFLVAGGLLALTRPAAAQTAPPTYLTQWGSLGSGNGQFNRTSGIAVDSSGNVYVVDANNHRIQKFSSSGAYLTKWGSQGSGNGQFNSPMGIRVDSSGNVYVTDNGNHRIQKFDSSGAYLTQWGSQGSGNGQFSFPEEVATDSSGNVYVTDNGNHRIQKFDSSGVYLTQWGSQGSGNGQFNLPAGIATDSSGNVYVAEYNNHRIQKFSSSGVYLTQWGSQGSGNGQFSSPVGVATDRSGNVYVADHNNHRFQMFSSSGGYLTQWGSQGSGNGQFVYPTGVATDSSGNVYVTDVNNHRIQKFAPAVATPTLKVESTGVSLTNGDKINVPVVFTSNGASVAAVGFALDYQESCLSFDATDSNDDGVPDAITGLPAAFAPSINYRPTTTDGELEIALYDEIEPIDTLRDGPLFTVQFTVEAACLPSAGNPTAVAVNFATSPAVSFGDPTGTDVAGTATGATIPLQPNVAPTAIALSNSSVAENSPISTTVGLFSTTDANSGDSHTYTLVSGEGDTDNASFIIDGETLQTAAVFDYETQAGYTIRVRTTDSNGLAFEARFAVSVTNLYEAPAGVANGADGANSDGDATTLDINEDATVGSAIATLAPSNPNAGSTYTYALVSGEGSDDNGSFSLVDGLLTLNTPLDFEAKSSYTIRVRITDDQGNSFEQILTITVNDIPDTVTAVDDFIDPRATIFVGGQAATIDVLANDLPTGITLAVASVTQPAAGGGSVTNNTTNVSYTAPQANGNITFTYQATDGSVTSNDATVSVSYVANDVPGDCNANGAVTAADFVGVVLEIFDANDDLDANNAPAWWLVHTGTFAGSPLGCDANGRRNGSDLENPIDSITAADITCTVLLFFGHECGTGVQAAGTSRAALSVTTIANGGQTSMPVMLKTGGQAVAAVAFALELGNSAFNATDADRDGVPDGVTLTVPTGMSKSVTWNAQAGQLEVALYGTSLPLPTLSDGVLATVTVDGVASPTLTQVSLSDTNGNDLLVPARASIFLPLVTR